MTPNVWVAFWLGIVLGANGGVLIAAIVGANAKQAACENAYLQGLKDAHDRTIANDTATTGAERVNHNDPRWVA